MPAVGGRWLVEGGDLPRIDAARPIPEVWDNGEMTAPFGRSSSGSDKAGRESASGSGDSAGDSWILSMLCLLSPLAESSLSLAAGRIESLFEGPRDIDGDVWPDGLAEPFMVPAIEVCSALEGGPMEVRFVGGSTDFRTVVGAVVVPRVDLPEEVNELSCLVGDLVGDLDRSA